MVKKPKDLSAQCLEVYLLLKVRLGQGVTPEMITDRDQLNIKEYTECITNLRKAGYGIRNVKKNLYVLVSEPEMTIDDVLFILAEARYRGYINLVTRCETKITDMQLQKEAREALL